MLFFFPPKPYKVFEVDDNDNTERPGQTTKKINILKNIKIILVKKFNDFSGCL